MPYCLNDLGDEEQEGLAGVALDTLQSVHARDGVLERGAVIGIWSSTVTFGEYLGLSFCITIC